MGSNSYLVCRDKRLKIQITSDGKPVEGVLSADGYAGRIVGFFVHTKGSELTYTTHDEPDFSEFESDK